jgi:hypothetical protein
VPLRSTSDCTRASILWETPILSSASRCASARASLAPDLGPGASKSLPFRLAAVGREVGAFSEQDKMTSASFVGTSSLTFG